MGAVRTGGRDNRGDLAKSSSAERLGAVTAYVERARVRAGPMAQKARRHRDQAAATQRYTEEAVARVAGRPGTR